MKTSTAALAILFVAVLCYQVSSSPSSVNLSGPCCFNYSPRPLPPSKVEMYQYVGSHCPETAVIFTTFAGRLVCGKLEDKWVQDIVKNPDVKSSRG